jgi:hypothetical protein
MIKQSVINTFERIGIPYKTLDNTEKTKICPNWINGETATVTPLIAWCVSWVYGTQLRFEEGKSDIRLDDFDRVRYFVLDQDKNAYMTLLD